MSQYFVRQLTRTCIFLIDLTIRKTKEIPSVLNKYVNK